MFGDLYNEELIGRAARELKAMRQRDVKANGWASNILVYRSAVMSPHTCTHNSDSHKRSQQSVLFNWPRCCGA